MILGENASQRLSLKQIEQNGQKYLSIVIPSPGVISFFAFSFIGSTIKRKKHLEIQTMFEGHIQNMLDIQSKNG